MVHVTGSLEVQVKEAQGLTNLDKSKRHPENMSDPHVIVKISDGKKANKIGKSNTIQNCLNPKWFYSFRTDVDQEIQEISFDVVDEDKYRSDKIGSCSLNSSCLETEEGFDGALDIEDKKGKPAGKLIVMVKLHKN